MKCREIIQTFINSFTGKERKQLIKAFEEIDEALFEKQYDNLVIGEDYLYYKMTDNYRNLINKLESESVLLRSIKFIC